jgi:hypothetical protein
VAHIPVNPFLTGSWRTDGTFVTLSSLRPGSYLGSVGPDVVEIDSTAASQGWFVDAAPNGAAVGNLNLLTAVMHELCSAKRARTGRTIATA